MSWAQAGPEGTGKLHEQVAQSPQMLLPATQPLPKASSILAEL